MEPTDIIEDTKDSKRKKKKDTISFYVYVEFIKRFQEAVPEGLRGRIVERVLTEWLDKHQSRKSKK